MSAVGYVLVSQVHTTVKERCPNWPTGRRRICPWPKLPRCNAHCLHDEDHARRHPECSQYEIEVREWERAHPDIVVPAGGTRLGPLHYFQDCHTLLHRGPRRSDARIVAVEADVSADFGLPVCKECQSKMAPLERLYRSTEQMEALA